MLNLTELFQMRVEPPKPGTGRVNLIASSHHIQKQKADIGAADRKEEVARRQEAARIAVLDAIASGLSLRADIAQEVGVSLTTIDIRIAELLDRKLVTVRRKGGYKHYRATGSGLMKLEDAGLSV